MPNPNKPQYGRLQIDTTKKVAEQSSQVAAQPGNRGQATRQGGGFNFGPDAASAYAVPDTILNAIGNNAAGFMKGIADGLETQNKWSADFDKIQDDERIQRINELQADPTLAGVEGEEAMAVRVQGINSEYDDKWFTDKASDNHKLNTMISNANVRRGKGMDKISSFAEDLSRLETESDYMTRSDLIERMESAASDMDPDLAKQLNTMKDTLALSVQGQLQDTLKDSLDDVALSFGNSFPTLSDIVDEDGASLTRDEFIDSQVPLHMQPSLVGPDGSFSDQQKMYSVLVKRLAAEQYDKAAANTGREASANLQLSLNESLLKTNRTDMPKGYDGLSLRSQEKALVNGLNTVSGSISSVDHRRDKAKSFADATLAMPGKLHEFLNLYTSAGQLEDPVMEEAAAAASRMDDDNFLDWIQQDPYRAASVMDGAGILFAQRVESQVTAATMSGGSDSSGKKDTDAALIAARAAALQAKEEQTERMIQKGLDPDDPAARARESASHHASELPAQMPLTDGAKPAESLGDALLVVTNMSMDHPGVAAAHGSIRSADAAAYNVVRKMIAAGGEVPPGIMAIYEDMSRGELLEGIFARHDKTQKEIIPGQHATTAYPPGTLSTEVLEVSSSPAFKDYYETGLAKVRALRGTIVEQVADQLHGDGSPILDQDGVGVVVVQARIAEANALGTTGTVAIDSNPLTQTVNAMAARLKDKPIYTINEDGSAGINKSMMTDHPDLGSYIATVFAKSGEVDPLMQAQRNTLIEALLPPSLHSLYRSVKPSTKASMNAVVSKMFTELGREQTLENFTPEVLTRVKNDIESQVRDLMAYVPGATEESVSKLSGIVTIDTDVWQLPELATTRLGGLSLLGEDAEGLMAKSLDSRITDDVIADKLIEMGYEDDEAMTAIQRYDTAMTNGIKEDVLRHLIQNVPSFTEQVLEIAALNGETIQSATVAAINTFMLENDVSIIHNFPQGAVEDATVKDNTTWVQRIVNVQGYSDTLEFTITPELDLMNFSVVSTPVAEGATGKQNYIDGYAPRTTMTTFDIQGQKPFFMPAMGSQEAYAEGISNANAFERMHLAPAQRDEAASFIESNYGTLMNKIPELRDPKARAAFITNEVLGGRVLTSTANMYVDPSFTSRGGHSGSEDTRYIAQMERQGLEHTAPISERSTRRSLSVEDLAGAFSMLEVLQNTRAGDTIDTLNELKMQLKKAQIRGLPGEGREGIDVPTNKPSLSRRMTLLKYDDEDRTSMTGFVQLEPNTKPERVTINSRATKMINRFMTQGSTQPLVIN